MQPSLQRLIAFVSVLALSCGFVHRASAQCPADLTGNGLVNSADLGLMLAAWGSDGTDEPGSDINADGIVNGDDLAFVIGAFGPCPTVPSWATLIEAQPDPAVVWDADLRAAITATGLAWRVKDTATQMEMLLIPPGTFEMGCSASNQYGCFSDESPVHTVTLTNAFYLGRYEVTQAQWVATMGSNPAFFQGEPDSPNRPVDGVNWNGAQGYVSVTGFRLPTEAEWEYACRAGTQTPFYNGSTDDNTVGTLAWFSDCCNGNSGYGTHPVGGKLANAFGFHDMLGNVEEWVNDRYGDYTAEAQTNPTGHEREIARVRRGGSWWDNTSRVRSSFRYGVTPIFSGDSGVGFRVARDP